MRAQEFTSTINEIQRRPDEPNELDYKNVDIDFGRLENKETLHIGTIMVDDNTKQDAYLMLKGKKRVYIDNNFTVFPDASREIGRNGPFITLRILCNVKKGDTLVPLSGVTGSIKGRKAGEARFEVNKENMASVKLDQVQEPSWTIHARNKNGETVTIAVPLPIRGAEANVVEQEVTLEFGRQAKGKEGR